MSLLDTASLIVTPNGYKEGKLYSVIPSDGSGDLSVTRATTATRVNSAGLVELVPYNLLQYSEDFSNAAWILYVASRASNTATAPDGTLTADSLIDTSSLNYHNIRIPVSYGTGVYTFSVYAKANTLSQIALQVFNGTTFQGSSVYDLAAGTTSGTGQTIESVGNGWYRCTFTRTITQGTGAVYIGTAKSGTDYYAGTGQSVFIWGAQLVEGSTAKDYQKTETRLNIPRLDYSNGTCPSILVEPQRTNYARYSEDLTNGSFFTSQLQYQTLVANPLTGLNNATKIAKTTSSGDPYIGQACSVPSSGAFTFSIWLWTDSGQPTTIDLYMYNLTATELVGNQITITTTPTRYTISNNFSATLGTINARIDLSSSDTNQFIYAYGFQLEAGNYSTSYIPTTSASVTRNADVISKTGISSLIGQTEGTIFWEGQLTNLNSFSSYFSVTSGAFTNSVVVGKEAGVTPNKVIFFIAANGTTILNNTSSALSSDYVKMAIAYKSGDWAAYLNGTLVASGTSTFSFSSNLSVLGVGTNNAEASGVTDKSNHKAAALWKTRLDNDTLATLTTL